MKAKATGTLCLWFSRLKNTGYYLTCEHPTAEGRNYFRKGFYQALFMSSPTYFASKEDAIKEAKAQGWLTIKEKL